MGSCVHETLEQLYKDLKYQKVMSLDDLIKIIHLKYGNQDLMIILKLLKENILQKIIKIWEKNI
jgi:hypothetical protein